MREKLLSIEDAADMLGRTPHAVYRLVARRCVPFRKDGRKVLFRESELREFIEALPGVSLAEIRDQDHAEVLDKGA